MGGEICFCGAGRPEMPTVLSPVLALGGAPLAGWAVPAAALAFGEVGGRSRGVRGCDRVSGILPCFLLDRKSTRLNSSH